MDLNIFHWNPIVVIIVIGGLAYLMYKFMGKK